MNVFYGRSGALFMFSGVLKVGNFNQGLFHKWLVGL